MFGPVPPKELYDVREVSPESALALDAFGQSAILCPTKGVTP